MGKVIILSGPVGAGKTTVARELLKLLPGEVSYIEGDTFWSFIAKTETRDRRANFRTIMRSMTAATIPFARSGFDVLLDFSVPPDFLPFSGYSKRLSRGTNHRKESKAAATCEASVCPIFG